MRPRKATDQQVFAAAGRVMMRVGPAQLTLTEIAAEAGLTAGALVQRFGSKHKLLVALSKDAGSETRKYFAQLRAAHSSPLAALRAYADCFTQLAASPATLAHNLAYLQLDMTDPVMRKQTLSQFRATRRGFRGLLNAAVKCGELIPATPTATLARSVEMVLGGSLIAWAFYRQGAAAAFVRQDLDAVLKPYLCHTRS